MLFVWVVILALGAIGPTTVHAAPNDPCADKLSDPSARWLQIYRELVARYFKELSGPDAQTMIEALLQSPFVSPSHRLNSSLAILKTKAEMSPKLMADLSEVLMQFKTESKKKSAIQTQNTSQEAKKVLPPQPLWTDDSWIQGYFLLDSQIYNGHLYQAWKLSASFFYTQNDDIYVWIQEVATGKIVKSQVLRTSEVSFRVDHGFLSGSKMILEGSFYNENRHGIQIWDIEAPTLLASHDSGEDGEGAIIQKSLNPADGFTAYFPERERHFAENDAGKPFAVLRSFSSAAELNHETQLLGPRMITFGQGTEWHIYDAASGVFLLFFENKVAIWDSKIGKIVRTILGDRDDTFVQRRTLLSPDGKKLIAFFHDRGAVWDVQSGRRMAQIPLLEHISKGLGSLYELTVTPDGRKMIGYFRSGDYFAWDTSTFELLWTFKPRHLSKPESSSGGIQISPDSQEAVVFFSHSEAPNSYWVYRLDLNTGRVLQSAAQTEKGSQLEQMRSYFVDWPHQRLIVIIGGFGFSGIQRVAWSFDELFKAD